MRKPDLAPRRAVVRRMPAADRRADILASVLPCFARLGFAAAGTRELAGASGVTEPVLYRHFRNKNDLFAGVLDLVRDRIATALQSTLAGHATASDRLRALVLALPDNLAGLRAELQILNGAACASESKAHQNAVRRVYEAIGDLLARALTDSDLRPGVDPQTAAHFVLEAGLGASLLRPLRVRGVTHRAYGDRALDLLSAALLGRGSSRRQRPARGGKR